MATNRRRVVLDGAAVGALGLAVGSAAATVPAQVWLGPAALAALFATVARPELAVAALGLAIPVGVEIPLQTIETGFTISETLYTKTTVGISPVDILLGLLAVAFVLRAVFDAELRRRLRTPLSGPLLVFWLVAGLSLLAQRQTLPPVALLICVLYWVRLGEVFSIYFITVALVHDRKSWQQCFRLALMGAIFGVSSSLAMNLLYPVRDEGWAPPVNFALQYSGEVGNFFILWMAVALGLFGLCREGFWRSLSVLLAGFAVLATLFLGKRMLLVGLVVAGIALAVLARRRVHLGLILSLAVLMAPLAVLALPGRLQERLAGTVVSDQETLHILWDDARNLGVPLDLVDSIDAIPVDPSARHRMIRWIIAVAAFLHNPILGVGFWASPWAGVGFTHNQYLQVLAEMGLVGFAALVWLMLAIGRSLRARAVLLMGPQAVALRWGLIASAVSLAVQGIAGSPLVLFNFMLAFLFLMALLVAGGRLAAERGSRT